MFQDLNPLDKPTAMLEILIMLAGAAIIGFFVGWLFQKLQRDKAKADLRFTTDKLRTLQLKADESARDQSDLTRIVEDLRSRKDALFSEVEALKGKNKQLEEHMAISPEDISDQVSTLNDKISRFKTERDVLRLEVEALKDKLQVVPLTPFDPKEMEELKIKISSLESERTTYQERIASLERLESGISERSDFQKDMKDPEKQETANSSMTYEDHQERKRSLIASVGTATEEQKDNFSKIIGIGPFIEAKLNSIGIFTYDQISRFTEEDIDHVTRLIEFFHGRIERDGWVRQAVKLIKKREEAENDEDQA